MNTQVLHDRCIMTLSMCHSLPMAILLFFDFSAFHSYLSLLLIKTGNLETQGEVKSAGVILGLE